MVQENENLKRKLKLLEINESERVAYQRLQQKCQGLEAEYANARQMLEKAESSNNEQQL